MQTDYAPGQELRGNLRFPGEWFQIAPPMPGLYISVPFCRTKCSFCNFASDVVSKAAFARYVERVLADIHRAWEAAEEHGALLARDVDSIYLGGGTPTVLDPCHLESIFAALRDRFHVAHDAEITVECAPGTLTPAMLEILPRLGVNRVSLGVQSFVDEESRAVGRLHTRAITLDDVARLRAAGIQNLSIDLIAGLPHQTAESWDFSLSETIATAVPHVSVYMLEVDDESRLGRELIAGGTRYHAHFVPDEDATAAFYERACERLNAAGVSQYEISNFARAGCQSRHNLKYWTRAPYLGFGVDAHSMLRAGSRGIDSVRLATPDSLERYVAGAPPSVTVVDSAAALEEAWFLGLRLNRGVRRDQLVAKFGTGPVAAFDSAVAELVEFGLLQREQNRIRLTSRGRLLSNDVFARFLAAAPSQR